MKWNIIATISLLCVGSFYGLEAADPTPVSWWRPEGVLDAKILPGNLLVLALRAGSAPMPDNNGYQSGIMVLVIDEQSRIRAATFLKTTRWASTLTTKLQFAHGSIWITYSYGLVQVKLGDGSLNCEMYLTPEYRSKRFLELSESIVDTTTHEILISSCSPYVLLWNTESRKMAWVKSMESLPDEDCSFCLLSVSRPWLTVQHEGIVEIWKRVSDSQVCLFSTLPESVIGNELVTLDCRHFVLSYDQTKVVLREIPSMKEEYARKYGGHVSRCRSLSANGLFAISEIANEVTIRNALDYSVNATLKVPIKTPVVLDYSKNSWIVIDVENRKTLYWQIQDDRHLQLSLTPEAIQLDSAIANGGLPQEIRFQDLFLRASIIEENAVRHTRLPILMDFYPPHDCE